MLRERIEAKWIACFARVFELCGVKPGESAAILSETQSREVNVQLAELALAQLGARAFHVVVPSPKLSAPAPIRSTGASDAIGQLAPVVGAPGSDGFGNLMSSTIERSNVDITEELVSLIAAQRNFQANAKALDTASQISETIFNIRS